MKNRGRKLEYRSVLLDPKSVVETRAADGSTQRTIRGIASVTGVEYTLWRNDDFEIAEIVRPGAFRKTLSEKHNIQVLNGHIPTQVLGSTRAGTATVWEEVDASKGTTGLHFEVLDVGTKKTFANDLWECMKLGEIAEASFGFYPIKWLDHKTESKWVRELIENEVSEVSVCGQGANPHTESEARSLFAACRNTEPDSDIHSEAGGEGLDEARDAATLEPDDDHSEIEARKKRDRLRARLRLLAEA